MLHLENLLYQFVQVVVQEIACSTRRLQNRRKRQDVQPGGNVKKIVIYFIII